MSDDLVKRLREDQPVTQDMGSTMQCALQDAAADRIEGLEAGLVKALELIALCRKREVEVPHAEDPLLVLIDNITAKLKGQKP